MDQYYLVNGETFLKNPTKRELSNHSPDDISMVLDYPFERLSSITEQWKVRDRKSNVGHKFVYVRYSYDDLINRKNDIKVLREKAFADDGIDLKDIIKLVAISAPRKFVENKVDKNEEYIA